MELSPVKTTLRIALVGDYNPDVIAHQAIPLAIDDAAAVLELTADYDWLATTELTSPEDLVGYDAIWLVPASPYKNAEAAFIAARYARENSVPFLGTCGGFQHALIEYARNVLGWDDAGHAETDTEGTMVIAPLTCSLVEKTDAIELRNNTLIAKAYGKPRLRKGITATTASRQNSPRSLKVVICASRAGTSRARSARQSWSRIRSL
jgi:CTP synthase (UTP-ammonia lyase)